MEYFSSKQLVIWDTHLHMGWIEIDFNSKILFVKLNASNIIVATKDHIFIRDLSKSMTLKAKLNIPNHMHLGRIALSSNAILNPYFLYTSSIKRGKLVVYDIKQFREINIIYCHKTPILKLAMNY